MEEVWKVAKVGLKRAPSHLVFVLKFRKVEKDPKGASTPDKEQWPRYEARKKLMSPRVFGNQKKFKQLRES